MSWRRLREREGGRFFPQPFALLIPMFLLVLLEISSEVDALHQRLFPNIAGYRHSRPKYINHPLPNIISTSSNIMAGVAVVLAGWTEIGESFAITT